jgi:hypothetical protein
LPDVVPVLFPQAGRQRGPISRRQLFQVVSASLASPSTPRRCRAVLVPLQRPTCRARFVRRRADISGRLCVAHHAASPAQLLKGFCSAGRTARFRQDTLPRFARHTFDCITRRWHSVHTVAQRIGDDPGVLSKSTPRGSARSRPTKSDQIPLLVWRLDFLWGAVANRLASPTGSTAKSLS